MKKLSLITIIFVLTLFLLPRDSVAQKSSDKVYWMITVEIALENLSKYHDLAARELIPMQEKYGYKFIGSWQTIVGNIQEVISISEFENMDAYNKARQDFLGSDEWKVFIKENPDLLKNIKTRFLRATSYSKIK